MQNKGFVKFFAILLTVVCLFYISFSVVTNHFESKYEEMAATDQQAADRYMDSLLNNKVYCGIWTLKECREMGIGLGLDLKGGMNVILEVSVPDVIKALADHKEETDETFRKAVEDATKQASESQSDFITLFVKDYENLSGGKPLAELFATQQLRDKVNTKSTDNEVVRVLREEVKSAIDNSYNVLRTRIDRFGVVQPNIQALEGQEGRIMIEMPGVKEPERVRKLLQGSANLEFWETYTSAEIAPYLQQLDRKLASAASATGKDLAMSDEESADSAAVVAEAQDSTAVDSTAKADLAAALGTANTADAEAKKSTESIAKANKEYPLASRLNIVNGGEGCVVGYATKREMEAINNLLNTPEAKEILPSDLRLKWGVKGMGDGEYANVYELYAIKVTERNGRAPPWASPADSGSAGKCFCPSRRGR